MRLSFVCLTMETQVRNALRCIAGKPLVLYKSGSAVKVYYLPGC